METYLQIITNNAENNKYTKYYCNIIKNAKNRNLIVGSYYEKHHILPRSFRLGGENDNKNIVKVTSREHFLLHFLLCKMKTTFHFSMVAAFGKMNCDPYGKRYINSKLYDYYRKNIGILISESKTGRIPIKNENSTKFIFKNELEQYLANGWMIGQYSSPKTTLARQTSNINRAGFVWINDSTKSMHIRKDELDKYISEGWLKGRGKCINTSNLKGNPDAKASQARRARECSIMNKSHKNKYVKNELISEYLNEGWVLGAFRITKNLKAFNDGIRNYMLPYTEGISKGYLLGRLKPTGLNLVTS